METLVPHCQPASPGSVFIVAGQESKTESNSVAEAQSSATSTPFSSLSKSQGQPRLGEWKTRPYLVIGVYVRTRSYYGDASRHTNKG